MAGQRGAFALVVLACALLTGCAVPADAGIACDIPAKAELAPCLDALGYRQLAPPTKAAVLASGGNWSPYDAVFTALLSSSDLATISRVCPEAAPRR